uniref:Uncharacterized protein n=2 Tax=Parascaris univalens TaxID=6257 RepID=A0A915AVZ4_PARUN
SEVVRSDISSHRLATTLVRSRKEMSIVWLQRNVMNHSDSSNTTIPFDNVDFFTIFRETSCNPRHSNNFMNTRIHLYRIDSAASEVILFRLAIIDSILLTLFISVCVFIGIIYIAMIRRVKRTVSEGNPAFEELVAEIEVVRKAMRESCPLLTKDENDMRRKIHAS